jgi:hypothetical protein
MPALDLGRPPEAERLDQERAEKVPRVGGPCDTVPREVPGTVHTDRQAPPGGLKHQLLGNPLGLAVAVLAGIRQGVEVGVLPPHVPAGREDPVGRDVVHRPDLVQTGQTQNLARPAHVGRREGLVRID